MSTLLTILGIWLIVSIISGINSRKRDRDKYIRDNPEHMLELLLDQPYRNRHGNVIKLGDMSSIEIKEEMKVQRNTSISFLILQKVYRHRQIQELAESYRRI